MTRSASISVNKGMDFIGKHMEIVNLLNRPDVLAKMSQDTPNDFDSTGYQRAIAEMGLLQPAKTSVHPMGLGGLAVVTTDKTGKSTIQQVAGNQRPQRRSVIEVAADEAEKNGTTVAEEYGALMKGRRRPTTMEEAQQIAEDEGRDVKDVLAEMQKYGITKAPKAGGLNSTTGGKPLKEREQDRKELKDKFERADKAADNAENALRTANSELASFHRSYIDGRPGAAVDGGKARQRYDDELARLQGDAKVLKERSIKARKRADDMNAELDKPAEEPTKPKSLDSAKPATGDKGGPAGSPLGNKRRAEARADKCGKVIGYARD